MKYILPNPILDLPDLGHRVEWTFFLIFAFVMDRIRELWSEDITKKIWKQHQDVLSGKWWLRDEA